MARRAEPEMAVSYEISALIAISARGGAGEAQVKQGAAVRRPLLMSANNYC
jgi:hypothetical protein